MGSDMAAASARYALDRFGKLWEFRDRVEKMVFGDIQKGEPKAPGDETGKRTDLEILDKLDDLTNLETQPCHACSEDTVTKYIRAGRCGPCFATWNQTMPTHMRVK